MFHIYIYVNINIYIDISFDSGGHYKKDGMGNATFSLRKIDMPYFCSSP